MLKCLALKPGDIAVLQEAQRQDESMYHKVMMKDIYSACVGGAQGLPPLVAQRITPWVDKRFCVHEGLLYTAASYSQYRDAEFEGIADEEEKQRSQLNKYMVLVIPPNTQIQISDPEYPQGELVNLRDDILLVVHDYRMHQAMGESMRSVRLIAWWPSILADVKYHIMTCALCNQARNVKEPAGLSTRALQRLAILQFDHCELDKAIQAATGSWGVLTMVDPSTGQLALAPADNKSATMTAYLLLIYWIRVYGIPKVLQSDADRGYCSDVMKVVSALLGIKAHDVSAKGQKGKAAQSERANAHVRKVETMMLANGHLSKAHLHMYLAMGEIKANQINEQGGHTSFERVFAQAPTTVIDLIAPGAFPPLEGAGPMNEEDSQWIKIFAQHAKDLHLCRNEVMDERARNATLDRDASISMSMATMFDLRPGDNVSYEGDKHKLLSVHGPEGEPITAMIEIEGKRPRKVRYSTLRPMSTARPIIRLPFISEIQEGAFVVSELGDNDGALRFGKVTAVSNDELTTQEWRPNENRSRWHAVYTLADGEEARVTHKGTPPPDSTPVLVNVPRLTVLTVGNLTTAGALTAELKDALRALGYYSQ